MIQDRLIVELEKVAVRFVSLWASLTSSAMLLTCSLLILLAASTGLIVAYGIQPATAAAASLGAVLAVHLLFRSRYLAPQPQWLVRQIEGRYPDLNNSLSTAIEQTPALPDGRYGFLQESVISQALQHASQQDWSQTVSRRRMTLAYLGNVATFIGFVSTVLVAACPSPHNMTAGKAATRPHNTSGTFSATIEPGDAEIERGNSLLVLARVQGPLPADSTLIYQSPGNAATRQAMSVSLDDPIFGARISAVTQPLEYHVELGGYVSPTYRVTVFEYPRLERADAHLSYPSYTGLEERLIQDIRTISVVEGTSVTLICRLNKQVKSARFVEITPPAAGTPGPTENAPSPESANKPAAKTDSEDLVLQQRESQVYEVKFTAEKTRRLKLDLRDESGRQNTEQALTTVQVVPNQPPTLKLVAPGRDLEVSPLEELDLKATAWDDYGMPRMGVSFGLAGQPPTEVALGQNAAARQRHEIANVIRFEDLKAQPDQLLAYHFWAEDFDSTGSVRRTSSDMFFAEVRHFDEIFRQGQQPPGGQQQARQQQQGNSQAGQAAQQLAQLQKDIINATWKLVRREVGPKVTEPFTDDVEQLVKSQSEALEQADGLGESVQDMESQAHLLSVLEAMQTAVKQLQAAHDQPASTPLQPALAAEQSAYQALLKLRAREHEVVRQQQQQSSSSSSQSARSQQQRQQMQQLDLTNEENRYETQRLAQAQQETAEDRETKQVLNRLKELARRQHDLNERLKDLQSALQEAQTEQKKEEVRQQLKRLQDEQRDVLRDTDELQSRMETPENQEQMAEERQQLEQARDQVQRTSEALDKDQVTQAAASGTRAEREFEDLRNEFRRRASGRFNEEMREMREAARDLDQQEEKLSQQLTAAATPDPSKKSLRDDNNVEQIAEGLNEQRARLSNLNERLKQTVQEAEQTEPLLSERLHDAARNLQEQNVERALDAANRSVRQGLLDDARQVEQIAGRGIDQLREGVEKAAEAVLGDETEALRRAREQLKNLAQELNQEIARNAPDQVPAGGKRGIGESDRQVAQATPGEGQNRDQDGEPKPGSRGEGEPADPSKEQSRPVPGQAASSNKPTIGGARNKKKQRLSDENPDGRNGEADQTEQPNNSTDQSDQERQPDDNQPRDNQSAQQPGQQTPRPGQLPGRQPQSGQGQAGQRGEGQSQQGEGQGGRRPGEQPSAEPSEGEGSDQQASSPGGDPMPPDAGQPSGSGRGQQPSQSPQDTSPPGQNGPRQNQQPGQRQGRNGREQRAGDRQGGDNNGGVRGSDESETTTIDRELSPISGEDFLNWSDRLRDVEEMVDDPELRAEVARVRDQARAIRAEMKRHSKTPNWSLVRVNVAEPLVELSNRVADELLRRNSKQAIVPLDRDPVPPKYSEKTRRYYERLGRGK